LGVPPPPHVAGDVHGLQKTVWLPHPLFCSPHVVEGKAEQVSGVQPASGKPHWPRVPPPPQVSGDVQTPQLSVPPQPSPAGPQLYPSLAQVVGVHEPPSG